jgi:hypothetical protein
MIMKYIVQVEIEVKDDENRTENAQQVMDFVIDQALRGKRKLTNEFNRKTMKVRVLTDEKLRQPFDTI